MTNPKDIDSKSYKPSLEEVLEENVSRKSESPDKGPMSFLSGALTSGLMAWICLILSRKLIEYFIDHSPRFSSPIAQSAASGFKTLVIGTSFLATFSFSFIGIGLLLVFFRSLFDVNSSKAS